MIQKTLVFVVDFTGKMIDGEKPVGFLRANDKNKNTIFLITPEQPTTQIKARFLAKTKHNDGVAVNGILTTDYKVNDLVSETKSYYEKIKDWNVFYFPVPERVVNYIASNAGSEIGITFEFVEWQLPRIKDIYGDFLGEITDRGFSIDANEDGYYVNRVIDYEYNGDKYGYNDLFIVGGGTITAIRAFPRTGGAVGGYFGVDPMYDSGVFDYVDGDDIDPSITTQIKNQVNNLTSEVYFLNVDNEKNKTDIATLKTQVNDLDNRVNDNASDIVDLDNRVNDNASDIDKIEDGTTIVEKALRDSLGNVIKNHYITFVKPTYNDNNNSLSLEPYNGDESPMPTRGDAVTLPKATTTKDGLMPKEDKTKLNNINIDVSNKLDKVWSNVVSQTMLNLTDEFVLNRGNQVYKTTLSTLLGLVVPTDIFIVVIELPEEGQPNKIYLVPKEGEEPQNGFDEYIWIDEDWEKLGSIDIDLSNYYTKTEVDALKVDKTTTVNGKALTTDIEIEIGDIAGLETNINTKADKTYVDAGLSLKENIADNNQKLILKADKTYVDTQDALKVDKNANITGATKTKITYDSKGLVTAGADLVESDIPPLAISKITGLQTALDDIEQNGVPYITTAPTSANTNGKLITVVLTSEPTTKYAGYFYIITEE